MKLLPGSASAAVFVTSIAAITSFAAISDLDSKLATQKLIDGRIRGLDPALASKYPSPSSILATPHPGSHKSKETSFTCLDGSKTIPASAVNDDYCDCPDGSDEPGTPACAGTLDKQGASVERPTFYCLNEGHIPGRVFSSRVNDGICDPECCDGSDEYDSPTHCPNTCEQIGKEYREQKEAAAKLRRTGAKIRKSYIAHAANEKARLQHELTRLEQEVEEKEGEVNAAKVRLDRLESTEYEEIERRKASPVYQSLLAHRKVLTRLRAQLEETERDLEMLKGILADLAENYNPNYQDVSVKAAVVGYQEYMGLPVAGSATDSGADSETGAGANVEQTEAEAKKDQNGEFDEIDYVTSQELDELEGIDTLALLLADGSGASGVVSEEEGESTLYRIDQYIPDALYGPYENLRDTLLLWLIRFGLIGKSNLTNPGSASQIEAAHTAAARTTYNNLHRTLTELEAKLESSRSSLERLSEDFGPDAEWKKLENMCINKEQGDYTYELCIFGRATQKSNKDHSSHLLGTFSGWNTNPHVPKSDPQYWSQQLYNRGLKCWNGPERSVTVDFECGLQNEILSVSEPEKCAYEFKATTPALCWPDAELGAGDNKSKVKDEL